MISKNIYHKNFIPQNYLNKKINKKLNKNFNKIFLNIKKNSDHSKDVFHSLSKKFKLNFHIKDLYNFKKFNSIVIIGMGGSILGAEGIYQFMENKVKKKIYFFDNLDEKKSLEFKNTKNIDKTLFLIISKSGYTLETLSNLIFFNVIRKNSKNIIIISEKKNNILFSLAKKFNLFYIEHKDFIGGRYSVLSEVGMVPAYLMGLNIKKFRQNIKIYLNTKKKSFLKESSLLLANFLLQKKYPNLVFLNYSPRLEKFLYWCQQLISESLGKKGKGFFPIVSNSPKDHHSLLQLYLAGPKDKMFIIFSLEEKSNIKLNVKKFKKEMGYLKNKTLSSIKKSQKDAMINVLKKNRIPFREFIVKKSNEETIGELFAYYILETAIIGKLTNINPFDQPAVEEIKVLTKKILSKSTKNYL